MLTYLPRLIESPPLMKHSCLSAILKKRHKMLNEQLGCIVEPTASSRLPIRPNNISEKSALSAAETSPVHLKRRVTQEKEMWRNGGVGNAQWATATRTGKQRGRITVSDRRVWSMEQIFPPANESMSLIKYSLGLFLWEMAYSWTVN